MHTKYILFSTVKYAVGMFGWVLVFFFWGGGGVCVCILVFRVFFQVFPNKIEDQALGALISCSFPHSKTKGNS